MDNMDNIWIWMLSTCLKAAATGFCLMAETWWVTGSNRI
jgi:hypothetical protein